MEKHRKGYAELRFYEKPGKEPVLALMGDEWIRYYGEGIDYLHFHNLFEIGYCIWGKGQLVMNKSIYDYADGTFTMISHNILHTTNSEHLCHWEYLFFDVEEIIKEAYKDKPARAEKLLHSINRKARVYNMEENHYMGEIIKMIFELMKGRNGYYKETIKGLLFSLVMQLAAQNEENAQISSLGNEGGSKISSSLEYISYHYNEDICIADLAKSCHLSETHFRRIFHEEISMSPVEYINLIRVQAACDLMRKKDSNMEEVAMRVGYQTMSTFQRNFGKIVGLSPYQWKKQMNKNLDKIENYHISAKKGW